MERSFGTVLSELRRAKELSQRKLASDLHISQALLSHYENGTREPGLPFVCRACDYFGVSADFILGRTETCNSQGNSSAALKELEICLMKAEDLSAREAARDYVDAAARRMSARLSGSMDELYLAEQNEKMSGAELHVIRARK